MPIQEGDARGVAGPLAYLSGGTLSVSDKEAEKVRKSSTIPIGPGRQVSRHPMINLNISMHSIPGTVHPVLHVLSGFIWTSVLSWTQRYEARPIKPIISWSISIIWHFLN